MGFREIGWMLCSAKRLRAAAGERRGGERRTRASQERAAVYHGNPGSVEPPGLANAVLLSQEPRDVLSDLAPRVKCPREAEHVPQGHRYLDPGLVAGGLRAGRETPVDGAGCLVDWFHERPS